MFPITLLPTSLPLSNCNEYLVVLLPANTITYISLRFPLYILQTFLITKTAINIFITLYHWTKFSDGSLPTNTTYTTSHLALYILEKKKKKSHSLTYPFKAFTSYLLHLLITRNAGLPSRLINTLAPFVSLDVINKRMLSVLKSKLIQLVVILIKK